MAEILNTKKQPHDRRLMVALTRDDYDRLEKLAAATDLLPAVCVRKILIDFLDKNEAAVADAQKLAAEMKAAREAWQARQISLFANSDVQ